MQYPLISEYVRAIQDASNNLDKLAHLVPVLDDHGEPYRSSGAFAVVFKMKDEQTGKCYALKCFTEEQEGRAEAYRQIADELEFVDSSYITSVKYLDKEIFVDSSCEEDEFPVLLMDWIDGETMESYIAENYQDNYAMAMLCYRFCKMAEWLRSQPFAHGDIKPDNIMVRPDGNLSLVDYDGMFVPTMKGQKSPTIGTKDFSHPLRTVDDFDETIDDFALASIALSLKVISMNSKLLDTYGASDRLLFSESDYRNPSNSKVISALQELMCDKDFCTLYSLFMLALARKELSTCSFRLFIGEKPILPQTIEDLPTKATEEELKEAFVDEWGVKYSKDGRKLLKGPKKLDGIYSIRKGTKIICEEAFRWSKTIGCHFLKNLVIPDSVTNIGDYAFWGCTSLKSLVIPDSVTSIGNEAFSGCRSLRCVVISDGVTSIGNYAFWGCKSLKSLVIPDSVTHIGNGAFNGCESLKSLVIPASVGNIIGNPFSGWNGELKCLSPYFIYDNKVLFDKDKSKIIAFRDKNTTSYVIPDSVSCIEFGAFWNCHSLKRLVLPDSVSSIGDWAFWNCRSLTDIVIPDSVNSIGDRVFSGCCSLKSLVIPDSVSSIGNWAFEGCTSLSSLLIPDSVTSIGHSAFKACYSLSNIVIPNGVTSIGNNAFWGCKSLVEVVIPDSVSCIGFGAFYYCSALRSVVIPDSVTCIEDWAFEGCTSLSSLVIPDSVTSIGKRAFTFCNFPYDLKQELISRFGEKIF